MAMPVNELDAHKVRGAWSEYKPEEDIVRARSLAGDIIAELQDPEPPGISTPIVQGFRFRPSELTIWGGSNGSGKSQLMSQLMLYMMMHGKRVCLFSFEMRPEETLKRMLRMAFGRPVKAKDIPAVDRFFAHFQDLLWIYRNRGAVEAQYALDGAFYAASELKCEHVVVDNLMMLASANNSDSLYQVQKQVVESLKQIADQTSAHVHLVAHLRKNQANAGDNSAPSRYDISGSADISNLADNVILINRNFDKEREALRTGMKTEQWDEKCDSLLLVDKQRANGRLLRQKLWYERRSGQFCPTASRRLFELAPQQITGIDLVASHQQENLWTDEAWKKEYGE